MKRLRVTMQYLGGKFAIRKQVAGYLESVREGREYLEPFVGGGWVLQEMRGIRYASDVHRGLITLYKALLEGWIPPENVSEDDYRKARIERDEENPLTAFIGFGCSFGGRYFRGYARDKEKRNYAKETKNALLKQKELFSGVEFRCCSYDEWKPENMLVYCDPPYEGVTNYDMKFDNAKFWDIMRLWSKNNVVVISEYKAPDDFECVLEMNKRMTVRDGDTERETRVERLFRYKG